MKWIRITPIERAMLLTEADSQMAGGTSFYCPDGTLETLVRENPEAMGIVLMAGAEAERLLFAGPLRQGYYLDMKILSRGRTDWHHMSVDEVVSAKRRLMAETSEIAAKYRGVIELVADELTFRAAMLGTQLPPIDPHELNPRR